MNNVLEYKGYFAKIEFSAEDRVLYGKIEGIKDLVNFESDSLDKIEQEFQLAVDDYIQMCEELGEIPDKAYSGTFNVRINPSLHRKIAMKAIKAGESLNCTVERAIEKYTEDEAPQWAKNIWNTPAMLQELPANSGTASYSIVGFCADKMTWRMPYA